MSELISDDTKILEDGSVVGTLHNVTDYTEFSTLQEEQSGHFFPVHLNVPGAKNMTLSPNGQQPENKKGIKYDPDIVFRVKSKESTLGIYVDGKRIVRLNFKQATLEE